MILDTNALSAVAEGEPAAITELARASEIAIPVIVLGEYRFGIHRSRHRKEYERWLGSLLAVVRVIHVSEPTTTVYAQIRSELKSAGTPIPSNDLWIAALCRQYAMPILTRDRHFDQVEGLIRINW